MEHYPAMMGIVTVIVIACLFVWPPPSHADDTPILQITLDSGAPYYEPSVAIASTSTVISWKNRTPSAHTVRQDDCVLNEKPCLFDSGIVEPDGIFTIDTLAPGVYAYHCQLHPIMRGFLLIIDEAPSNLTSLSCIGMACR